MPVVEHLAGCLMLSDSGQGLSGDRQGASSAVVTITSLVMTVIGTVIGPDENWTVPSATAAYLSLGTLRHHRPVRRSR